MNEKSEKTYGGKRIDCGSPLELYEIDFDNHRRVMHCSNCGLYHFYEKDFLGRWKLVRATKQERKFQ